MKTLSILVCLCLCSFIAYSQDISEAKKVVSILCSQDMYGRGYLKNGDRKAADFIAKEYSKIKLTGQNSSNDPFFQLFDFSINTFPGEVKLKTKTELKLGSDYIMAPFSGGGKGKAKVALLDTSIFTDTIAAKAFLVKNFKRKAVVYQDKWHGELMTLGLEYVQKVYSAKAIIKLMPRKLTGSLSSQHYSPPLFEVLKDSFDMTTKKIKFEVEAVTLNHRSQNVIGYIKGTENPDSTVIMCAHYDHLGGQGSIYFPGANDNAVGIAMLLQLAKYYKNNPPRHSMLFIAFAGEEAGLVGSKYYVNNPYSSLEKIKFVLNLDLVATGNKGAMIVNGKTLPKAFDKIERLNNNKNYFSVIKKRGEAANSDHYYFSEQGVPAFFIYLMGDEITAYHDIYDIPEKVPYSKFSELMHLLIDFNDIL